MAILVIPNCATPLATLLAGDVQAIENVPTPDLARVRADASLSMFFKVSHRFIYHQQVTTRAAKKAYVHTLRTDERTHAFSFRPQ